MLRTAPVAEARRPRPARPRQKPAYASLAKGQALRGARGPGASASHVECKAARSMAMPRFLSAARSLHSAPMTLGCDGPRPWPSPQAAPSPRRRDFLKHGCLTSPRRKFGPPSALRSKTPRPPAARAVKRAFKRKASRPSRCPPPLLLSRPCGGPSPLVPPSHVLRMWRRPNAPGSSHLSASHAKQIWWLISMPPSVPGMPAE